MKVVRSGIADVLREGLGRCRNASVIGSILGEVK